MLDIQEQIKIISKGADEIIGLEELKEKLLQAQKEEHPLIVKLGLDPSAPDIHLGHAVVLRKIKQLQDLGHKAVIIIGDFTGMIGDPTGKSKARRQLTKEEVLKNAKTYKEQIFKILDETKTEVKFNSEWLSELNFSDVINLAAQCTVARMLEREDFKQRFESHESIGIHEFFYPLMQGYDSVAIQADIELGGTEQRFNILMGRTLQKNFEQESQIALFMPILEGIDGVEKMSKSLGNYVGINEPPEEMYGKIMSIPDDLMIKYFELATDLHPDEIDHIRKALYKKNINPRDIKMRLALEVTTLYHGKKLALSAQEQFRKVFQQKRIPDEIPVFIIDKTFFLHDKVDLVKIIVTSGLSSSNSETRRLISAGAVKINGEKINTLAIPIKDKAIIQVGRRKFLKIRFERK